MEVERRVVFSSGLGLAKLDIVLEQAAGKIKQLAVVRARNTKESNA